MVTLSPEDYARERKKEGRKEGRKEASMIEMQHYEDGNFRNIFLCLPFILSNISAFTNEHQAASGSTTGFNPLY
jgi:hypothetical protein